MADASSSSPLAGESGGAHLPAGGLGRSLIWLLYTNNPFYLISACLVFHGVALWYRTGEGPHRPWELTALIVGYIVMMAAAGFGLVRFGRVWEDARSILLIIVVLFLVLALSLDDTILNNLAMAGWLSVGGFLFAVVVSETLLLGLRIRLPLPYRLPYYGMLALLLLYPLALLPDVTGNDPTRIAWRIFYFSPLAAVVFLSLLPAIRRGSALVADNGTPWHWPRYPWALFITLGGCVCYRAYSLSLSFDPVLALGHKAAMEMQSAFGAYFFVPVLFVAGILLIEFGIVTGNAATLRIAVAMPALCLVSSIPDLRANPAYAEFLALFTDRLASPIHVTAWAACLFFAYGLVRRVHYAEAGLIAALLLLSIVGPNTNSFETMLIPQPTPLAILSGLELISAVRTKDSRRFAVGGLAGVGVLHWAAAMPWLETTHVAAGAILLIGVLCRDKFALKLRLLSAAMLALGCASALFFPTEDLGKAAPVYVATLIAISIGLAVALRSPAFGCSAIAGLGAVGVESSRRLLRHLHDWPGIESFLLASLAFTVAVGISVLKTDVGRRILVYLRDIRPSATNDSD